MQVLFWCYDLPEYLPGRASNKFLTRVRGYIIPLWSDILAGRPGPEDCSKSMTTSSASQDWQRKMIFKEDEEEPIQAKVNVDLASDDTMRRVEARVKTHSQKFPEKRQWCFGRTLQG